MVEASNSQAEFHLRDYVPTDFESLWRLDQICFTRGIAYSKQELAHYLGRPKSFTLLAQRDAQVSGFIVVEHQRQTGRVITIDVAPEARRTGLGNQLMDAAEERLRSLGCSRVILEVAVDNLTAIKFYRRRGYSVTKTIPRYYHDSLDALQMQKAMNG